MCVLQCFFDFTRPEQESVFCFYAFRISTTVPLPSAWIAWIHTHAPTRTHTRIPASAPDHALFLLTHFPQPFSRGSSIEPSLVTRAVPFDRSVLSRLPWPFVFRKRSSVDRTLHDQPCVPQSGPNLVWCGFFLDPTYTTGEHHSRMLCLPYLFGGE